MAKADIKAGRAYVELYVNRSAFVRGMDAARKRLNTFGDEIMSAGMRMTAAAATIGGGIALAVAKFTTFGSQIDDISKRTGVAASSIVELGYAAEQSGSNIETVEKVLTKLNRTIGDAQAGSKTAAEALSQVGISAEDLQTLNTEQIFTKITDALAEIPNDATRAALAMKVFGKSGTQILPMLGDIQRLRQEARELGIVPTDEAVQNAADLGDAFDRAKRVVSAAFFEIGAAIAPVAKQLVNFVTVTVSQFIKFIRENGRIVIAITKTVAKFVAMTAAVVAFGVAVKVVAGVLGGLLFLLSTPAIAGGLAAIFAAGTLAAKLFGEEAKRSLGAVSDFVSSGNFTAAWQVIIQSLKVAWLEFTTSIPYAINEALRSASKSIVSFWRIIGRDITGMNEDIDRAFDNRQRPNIQALSKAQQELARLRTEAAKQSAAMRANEQRQQEEASGPLSRVFSSSMTAAAIMATTRGESTVGEGVKEAIDKQTAISRQNTAAIVAAIRGGRLAFS
jgi:TP901 family phage tail tape measure protein